MPCPGTTPSMTRFPNGWRVIQIWFPIKDSMKDANGIPQEAMLMMSPDKVMPIMSPAGWEGRGKVAPVKGAPGLTIALAECPPGDSAGLHKHTASVENFFCLQSPQPLDRSRK